MVANGSVEVLCGGVGNEVERQLGQLINGIGCVHRQPGVRSLKIEYLSYRA